VTGAELQRLGGLATVAAAALLMTAQIVGSFLSTDPTTIAATMTSVTFLVFALLKLVGSVLLMLGLVSLYARQASAAGGIGLAGFLTAFTGTALVTGDWWFEAFVVPWLAAAAPGLVAAPAGGTLLLGGGISFSVFAVGWGLFAGASLRARVYPRWMAVLLLAGALLAYGQGRPPLGALLAVAVGLLGLASLRAGRRDPTADPVIPDAFASR
jgi:hypothetical protein